MTSACIAKATFFASFHGLLHQSKYADVFKNVFLSSSKIEVHYSRGCFCIIQVIFVTFPAKKRPQLACKAFIAHCDKNTTFCPFEFSRLNL